MSVCILQKSAFDVLVTAGMKRGLVPLTQGARYGQKLYQTNVDAFNFRYASSPRVAPVEAKPLYRFESRDVSESEIRETLESYLYNVEDLPGFNASEAAKYLRQLHHALSVVIFA